MGIHTVPQNSGIPEPETRLYWPTPGSVWLAALSGALWTQGNPLDATGTSFSSDDERDPQNTADGYTYTDHSDPDNPQQITVITDGIDAGSYFVEGLNGEGYGFNANTGIHYIEDNGHWSIAPRDPGVLPDPATVLPGSDPIYLASVNNQAAYQGSGLHHDDRHARAGMNLIYEYFAPDTIPSPIPVPTGGSFMESQSDTYLFGGQHYLPPFVDPESYLLSGPPPLPLTKAGNSGIQSHAAQVHILSNWILARGDGTIRYESDSYGSGELLQSRAVRGIIDDWYTDVAKAVYNKNFTDPIFDGFPKSGDPRAWIDMGAGNDLPALTGVLGRVDYSLRPDYENMQLHISIENVTSIESGARSLTIHNPNSALAQALQKWLTKIGNTVDAIGATEPTIMYGNVRSDQGLFSLGIPLPMTSIAQEFEIVVPLETEKIEQYVGMFEDTNGRDVRNNIPPPNIIP